MHTTRDERVGKFVRVPLLAMRAEAIGHKHTSLLSCLLLGYYMYACLAPALTYHIVPLNAVSIAYLYIIANARSIADLVPSIWRQYNS